jgi:hypothetical protein
MPVWLAGAGPATSAILLGTYGGPIRTAAGGIDIGAMMNKFEEGGINFYNYLIQDNENDWPDLPKFLEAANRKGVTVMVTLVPASEPPCSKPFCLDFDRWGRELAQMSLSHANLIGYSIDDWYLLSPRGSGRAAAKAVNPAFKFYPTIYSGCGISQESDEVDGVILYPEFHFYVRNPPNKKAWTRAISSCLNRFPGDTIVGVYAWPTDYATAQVARTKLTLAYGLRPRAIVAFSIPWSGPMWETVAGLYRLWAGIAATTTATVQSSDQRCRPPACP